VLLPGYAEPERGDVAVYRSPDERDGNPTVVKRIVGTEGDTLHMRGGRLFVNGDGQTEPYAARPLPGYVDETHPDFDWLARLALPQSRFGPPPAQPTHDNWGPIVVPPHHFFSLGDNRYDSKDARYYGFVPRDNLRGRPLFVYYSYNADDSDRPLPFITDIRWSRIGDGIR
ncbi:MAG: signal peptidase I, partial [Candidatus Rokuibacteriota bacterium]